MGPENNSSFGKCDMSVTDALHILGLDDYDMTSLTSSIVIRQYRRMALKCHPDKNGNSPESTKEFHNLSNAYDIVRNMISMPEEDDIRENTSNESTGYFDILSQFVKSVMKTNDSHESNSEHNSSVFRQKIIEIVRDYQDISVSMFENIDRETSISIYQFLCCYREILYISPEVLERIRSVIQSKFEELCIYTISPTLDDMFLDKVFKLNIDSHMYLVPLWHKEVYFDDRANPEQEILVLCEPQVDDRLCRLDENNNIHIAGEVSFSRDLLNKDGWTDITIPGSVKKVRVFNHQLTLSHVQIVRIVGEGILRIHEKDMYNNIDRGDIFVTVRFG